MNGEWIESPGLHNPDWCAEQQRLVRRAMDRGEITRISAMPQPVPGLERAPAVNVARKTQPTKAAILKKRN